MLDVLRFDHLLRNAWTKSRLNARKAFPGAWAEMILDSSSSDFDALAAIGMLYCKQNGIEPEITKDQASLLKLLISRSGIDLRRSLAQYGLKRIQLDIRTGSIFKNDWTASSRRIGPTYQHERRNQSRPS